MKQIHADNDKLTQQPKNERILTAGYRPGLDGLRALAVLAVIAYHLNLGWAPGGLLGVGVFFVLSGYLITGILLVQWEKSGSVDLKDFWLRRLRRLLPALLAMLAGVIVWAVLCAPDRLAGLGREILAALSYTSNWHLIFHQVSYFESFGPPSPLGHLWSLAVEGQFYVFWPLLLIAGLRFLPRRKWVVAGTLVLALISAAAMALLYTPGYDPSRVYYGTDTRVFALLTGAILAFAWPGGKLSADLSVPRRLALDAAGCAGLLVIMWMMIKTNEYQPFLYQGGLLLFAVASAVVVAVLAHPASFLAKIFGLAPLRWLGVFSYGIYLWHYPVIVLTSPAVNTGGTDIVLALAQVAASIVLAALSFFLIEKPVRYGRRQSSAKWMPVGPSNQNSLVAGGKKTLVNIGLIFGVICLATYSSASIFHDTDLNAAPSPGGAGAHASAWVEPNAVTTDPGRAEPQAEGPETGAEGPAIGTESPGADSEDPVTDKEGSGAESGGPGAGSENPVTGSDGPAEEERTEPPAADVERELSGHGITVIGDSVMLDAGPVLQKRLPGIVVDAKIGRQMHQAPDVISALRASDKIGKTVIIELGSNGSFTPRQLIKALECVPEAERIVLVNARVPKPWQDVVNETLVEVAATDPRIILVDWHAASRGHDDYFYADGVHLKPSGAEAYGELLVKALFS